ncbi:hypothetical protein HU200_057271 [Digitaria exilis]|uniref:Protein kinase domain-containing protein n=1 Tax=Digitaria exilis TaxID=1010633 RepID=A0A835E592_9POAL|nr:hypothetical protein HU200_057271 [Digitaria exilis]
MGASSSGCGTSSSSSTLRQGQGGGGLRVVGKFLRGAIGFLLAMEIALFHILLRREKRRMAEYFEKNGGPILKEVNNIKIFKKEELKLILKSHNIIGKGAFGEVYKGLLNDQEVAVKKPAVNVDAAQKGQFANEVIIQSRIIHRNIVRLIGCCLEVDVPILVYEFISKGSLHDILHGDNLKPLNLDQRLSIAAESAEGLAYMHSKTNTTILHGDVKPANILLNDDFVPKISDFGISRLIAIDKAQQEKKKATYSDNGNLIESFLDAHKKKSKGPELFDMEITTTGDQELLECLARIDVECLEYDVDQRPDMTYVAERLLLLKRSHDN